MIIRTYGCPACNHIMDVQLTSDQVDDPPPACPMCAQRTNQEFRPVAIGGSAGSRAAKIAETIAEQDYGVSNMKLDGQGGRNKITYAGTNPGQASTWGAAQGALQTALAVGRQTRMENGGTGIDILQRSLKDGTQADLIEISKRRSARIW